MGRTGSIPITDFHINGDTKVSNEVKEELFNNIKNAAYRIIEKKGATYYAVALAVRRIVDSILDLPLSNIEKELLIKTGTSLKEIVSKLNIYGGSTR